MPLLLKQSHFQRWDKPSFCYLCGGALDDGSSLNYDHCPPQSIFAVEDRVNYPIKIKVHERCNHQWHLADETMSVFFDILHGTGKATDPKLRHKLKFADVENAQGTYRGITAFPLRPITHRIIRCMHALFYGSFLEVNTLNHVHYPIPEVGTRNKNAPVRHEMQTYQFASELCTAQRTRTYDGITAYNGKFKYVCTWHTLDNGLSVCLFAFDIYSLHNFAVKIDDYPKSVIGFYAANRPEHGTKCSQLKIEHPDEDILYPILDV